MEKLTPVAVSDDNEPVDILAEYETRERELVSTIERLEHVIKGLQSQLDSQTMLLAETRGRLARADIAPRLPRPHYTPSRAATLRRFLLTHTRGGRDCLATVLDWAAQHVLQVRQVVAQQARAMRRRAQQTPVEGHHEPKRPHLRLVRNASTQPRRLLLEGHAAQPTSAESLHGPSDSSGSSTPASPLRERG